MFLQARFLARWCVGPSPIVFIHGEIDGMDYWEHQLAEFSREPLPGL